MSERSHILPLPVWSIVLRSFQLALAITILGLAAYGINYFGGFDGIDLNMFIAIVTIITVVYTLVASFILPVAYNYWAILGLDTLAVIFWLISFALLASEVSGLKSDLDSYEYCYGYYCVDASDSGLDNYYHILAATAGLGAVEFVLFVITLIFTSIWLHRHRKAGGHCIPSTNTYNASPVQNRNPVVVNDENRAPAIPMVNIAAPEKNLV